MFLLDTNTIINYLDASLPASAMQFMKGVVDDFCNISVISKMEVLGYNFDSQAEQTTIETFVFESVVLSINEDIINKTISIRRSKKIKLPDAIIAATAFVYNYSLISRNVSDFKNISGLEVIDPYLL